MILLVFTATLLVMGSTYYQYRKESDQYNTYRQDRKETQLTKQINYMASKVDLANNEEKWEKDRKEMEEEPESSDPTFAAKIIDDNGGQGILVLSDGKEIPFEDNPKKIGRAHV